jgi:hypothetical protein
MSNIIRSVGSSLCLVFYEKMQQIRSNKAIDK